ncbi:hypothetical protein ACH4YN_36870 [Streptomyces griseofuscus]|uniref:hypothetical protein n=1 Tax=Streptomyces griseofuscus TaxID=146922 RepID=UPI003796457A
MDDSSAKRQPRRRYRLLKQCADAIRDLRKWTSDQGRSIPGDFLRGAAYKLGSGAVTLLILWRETHH